MRQEFLNSLTDDQAALLYACVNKNKQTPIEWESFKCIKTRNALKALEISLPHIKEEHKILGEEVKEKVFNEFKYTMHAF